MGKEQKIIRIDKIIQVFVGLILLLKGYTAFGITLIVFGMTSINFEL